MYLDQISFNNFRCLVDRKLEFDRYFNLIYGRNGQGKTSLIEAVYFLATGKSFRTKKVKEIRKYNLNRLTVFGKYIHEDFSESVIAVDVNEDKRDFYIDRRKNKYINYVGLLNIISFIPEDIELIIGNPGVRRGFFNYEISQAKKEYLQSIVNFEKILKIRNKLIKEKETGKDIYKIYNEKFIEEGLNIVLNRREFIKKLSILLNLNYRKLFDESSELKLKYECFLGDVEKKTREELKKIFEDMCKKKIEREKILGYSLLGPQKDDFIFELNGKNAKAYSSQGEKKSIVFSLKISEIDILMREKKEYPIFIMDDIASYFDEIRKKSILNYFLNKKIQCFITSTEDLGIEGKKFVVEKGEIEIK